VITDTHELLAFYARGMITHSELVIRLIEASISIHPEVIASVIPTETLAKIREMAAAPQGIRWVMFRSVCNAPSTTEERELDEKREQEMWQEGLNRWRSHFGFTA
jgi:hypothetical protein